MCVCVCVCVLYYVLAAPLDKPRSRISCNLCHNYQSNTNRYSICLSAFRCSYDKSSKITSYFALKGLIFQNVFCFKALEFPCKVAAGLTMQPLQGLLIFWYLCGHSIHIQVSVSEICSSRCELMLPISIHRPNLSFYFNRVNHWLFSSPLYNGVWASQKNKVILNVWD